MAATQVQIAAELGIDVSTANKILNKVPGPVFKKETIRRVFAKAKELGYKPTSASKGQMRRTLGLLFPQETANSTLAILRGVSLSEVVRIKKMLYETTYGGDKR